MSDNAADVIIRWSKESTRKTAIAGIESKAIWVRDDATDLARYVRLLETLPGYELSAEAAAQEAELALTEALLAVKLARVELNKKRDAQ